MSDGLLGIGQSALRASYAQLQTTGHNIANANTPGYSRQEAVLTSAGGNQTSAGFVGRGVQVSAIQRQYDRFLGTELAAAQSAASADEARGGQLEQLQRIFADTANGTGAGIDDLNAALADVVNRASDPTARQIVVERAATLAGRIDRVDSQLERIAAGVDERLEGDVQRVNELVERLAGVNQHISMAQAGGQKPNDLFDERDRLVLELSGFMRVMTDEQEDGTISVFTSRGDTLLIGNRMATVGYDAGATPKQVYVESAGVRLRLDAAAVGGGSIGGLMRFRDDDLAALRDDFRDLASGIAETWNAHQALGVDAAGQPGQPMFEYDGAGGSFRSLLVSGSELAAAYAVTAGAAPSNTGTLQIAAFAVTGPASGSPVTITFDADSGTYDLSGDPSGGPYPTGVPYAAGSSIEFDGWSLTLRGAPANGDVIGVVPNRTQDSDGRNARAMILGSEKLTDQFARLVGEVGARTQSAQSGRATSQMLLGNAQAAQAQHSGVDLDEEAARLLQYQQMYQAAAKVIQTAQSMFDTLLAVASR